MDNARLLWANHPVVDTGDERGNGILPEMVGIGGANSFQTQSQKQRISSVLCRGWKDEIGGPSDGHDKAGDELRRVRGAAGIWEGSGGDGGFGRFKQIYQLAELSARKDLKVLFVSKMT